MLDNSKDSSEEKSPLHARTVGNKAGYHRVIRTTSLLFSTQIIGREYDVLESPFQDRCISFSTALPDVR